MGSLPFLAGPDLAALASYGDVLAVLEDALRSGTVDPEDDSPRLFSPAPGGEFLMMPKAGSAWSGVKVVTVAPDNPSRGKPKIQGVYALFSSDDLAPVALMDAAELTLLRTPATTVLAIKHLLAAGGERNHRPLRVALYGTGPQAERHLRCMTDALGELDVVVFGRRPEAASTFAQRCGQPGVSIRPGNPKDVGEAAVVLCATSGSSAVVEDHLVPDGAVVAAIGSHGPDRAELPAALVRRSDVVVEARGSAMRESGNLLQARTVEEWSHEPVANLADLVRGQVDRAHGKPAVFSGVGMAWEDLVVAAALFEKHQALQRARRV